MSIKRTNLKVGDTYYFVQTNKMGNTTLSTLSVYDVKILEFDLTSTPARRMRVRWNSYNTEWWDIDTACKRLRTTPPTVCNGMWDAKYKATRADIASYHATGEPVCYDGFTGKPIPRKPVA